MSDSDDSDEETRYYFDFILRLHDPQYVPPASEVEALCKKAIEIFSAEPSLVIVPAPALILGGLSGCINGTIASLTRFVNTMQHYTYINLGDYTGDHCCSGRSFASLLILLACKCHGPETFVLLRGKQETPEADQWDLLDELEDDYGDTAPMLFDLINYMYTTMPLAALVGGAVLCVSGGISPHLNSLDDIRNIRRPCAEMSNLEIDLIWGAPKRNLNGFTPNPEVEGSHYFGDAEIESACERLGLKLIVCSEKNSWIGLRSFAKTKLIQVYSRVGEDHYGAAIKLSVTGKFGIVTYTRSRFIRESAVAEMNELIREVLDGRDLNPDEYEDYSAERLVNFGFMGMFDRLAQFLNMNGM